MYVRISDSRPGYHVGYCRFENLAFGCHAVSMFKSRRCNVSHGFKCATIILGSRFKRWCSRREGAAHYIPSTVDQWSCWCCCNRSHHPAFSCSTTTTPAKQGGMEVSTCNAWEGGRWRYDRSVTFSKTVWLQVSSTTRDLTQQGLHRCCAFLLQQECSMQTESPSRKMLSHVSTQTR